jgi:hypothetical protein
MFLLVLCFLCPSEEMDFLTLPARLLEQTVPSDAILIFQYNSEINAKVSNKKPTIIKTNE